ncbi:MAG: hypothetical protein HETSPECPRED_004558 [Heterodermia speciosa]|uniref:Uncharacterized protein n=1 Tax=Heterodermia speciosa TaxID=116794 RepID=A0A8H3INA5_9LECA|nr:MAG: hypothetical protein HETSPECPRED_004558 [Heterodermia speciosa]
MGADSEAAIEPGGICPLPGSDNQIWLMGDDDLPLKMSSTNKLKVPAAGKKNVGMLDKVEDCAKKWLDAKTYGFHDFQPYFPGGPMTGERSCEIITESVTEDNFAPLFKPNQYLTGLLVHDHQSGMKARVTIRATEKTIGWRLGNRLAVSRVDSSLMASSLTGSSCRRGVVFCGLNSVAHLQLNFNIQRSSTSLE